MRNIDLAVSAHPVRQRQVFVLQEYEGLGQAEIAGIMEVPLGTVKSLMHRAVRRLQTELADYRPRLEIRSKAAAEAGSARRLTVSFSGGMS